MMAANIPYVKHGFSLIEVDRIIDGLPPILYATKQLDKANV